MLQKIGFAHFHVAIIVVNQYLRINSSTIPAYSILVVWERKIGFTRPKTKINLTLYMI